MKNKRALSVLLIAGLAGGGLALSGCHKKQQHNPGQQMKQGAQQFGQGARNAASKAGQGLSDAAITSKVKGKLAANQGLSSLNIHVDTDSGVVTLSGTVDMVSKKDLAERIARDTQGVKDVHNNIQVRGG